MWNVFSNLKQGTVALTQLFIISLLFQACSTVTPGVDYELALTPVTLDDSIKDELSQNQSLDIMEESIKNDLLKAFESNRVAKKVLQIDSKVYKAVGEDEVKLIINPILKQVDWKDWEMSSKWSLSGLLWFTTWMGGMFVDDRSYDVNVIMEFEILDSKSKIPIDFQRVESGAVTLDFWDRNEVVSWGLLQSFILPPFWTSQDEQCTYNSIIRVGLYNIAEKFKQYLVEKYPTIESIKKQST